MWNQQPSGTPVAAPQHASKSSAQRKDGKEQHPAVSRASPIPIATPKSSAREQYSYQETASAPRQHGVHPVRPAPKLVHPYIVPPFHTNHNQLSLTSEISVLNSDPRLLPLRQRTPWGIAPLTPSFVTAAGPCLMDSPVFMDASVLFIVGPTGKKFSLDHKRVKKASSALGKLVDDALLSAVATGQPHGSIVLPDVEPDVFRRFFDCVIKKSDYKIPSPVLKPDPVAVSRLSNGTTAAGSKISTSSRSDVTGVHGSLPVSVFEDDSDDEDSDWDPSLVIIGDEDIPDLFLDAAEPITAAKGVTLKGTATASKSSLKVATTEARANDKAKKATRVTFSIPLLDEAVASAEKQYNPPRPVFHRPGTPIPVSTPFLDNPPPLPSRRLSRFELPYSFKSFQTAMDAGNYLPRTPVAKLGCQLHTARQVLLRLSTGQAQEQPWRREEFPYCDRATSINVFLNIVRGPPRWAPSKPKKSAPYSQSDPAAPIIIESKLRRLSYADVFVAHAKTFAFARAYSIIRLEQVAWHNLAHTLSSFTLHEERLSDVWALAKYIYSDMQQCADRWTPLYPLRFLIVTYTLGFLDEVFTAPARSEAFTRLLSDVPHFGYDLMEVLMMRQGNFPEYVEMMMRQLMLNQKEVF